jgi:hypothetical protein
VNLDPQYHLPPGRRAAVDALTSERFSQSLWWVTPRPEFVDSKLTQGIRRRALSEALDGIDDNYEETA